MVRVLHVLGGLGTGGTESLIMNWYRNIDRSKVQFDFLVRSNDDNYINEIQELGGRVFYTATFPRHFIRNYKETKQILERKEWDVVHVHGNAAIYLLPLALAKKLNYKIRIMHSHNVQAQSKIFSLFHYANRKLLSHYTTHNLACSEAAGNWMFGNNEFKVMKNAVDIVDFQFAIEARKNIREKYNLDDKFVVGHIGRFANQKNHMFLLEIFKNIKKQKNNSVLILVGDGELQTAAEKRASELGILDSVLFMGRRNDIGRVLSAMDVFVLPSLYEGLGNVLVEAQLNGLKCFVSEEAYNREVQFLPDMVKLPLKEDAAFWSEKILNHDYSINNRDLSKTTLENSGYDIKKEVISLENIYQMESLKG